MTPTLERSPSIFSLTSLELSVDNHESSPLVIDDERPSLAEAKDEISIFSTNTFFLGTSLAGDLTSLGDDTLSRPFFVVPTYIVSSFDEEELPSALIEVLSHLSSLSRAPTAAASHCECSLDGGNDEAERRIAKALRHGYTSLNVGCR